MPLSQEQQEFARQAALLITHIFSTGYKVTFGECLRTPEQAELYAKQGKGIKDSLHCQKLAIDLNLFDLKGNYLTKTEDYKFVGEYWESLDPKNRWGGRFTRADGNHVERNVK